MAPSTTARTRTRRTRVRVRAIVAFALVSLLLSATLAALAYSLVRNALVEDRREAAMRQSYTNARIVRGRLLANEQDVPTLVSGLRAASAGDVLLRWKGDWYQSSVGVERGDIPPALRTTADQGDAASQIVPTGGSPVLAVGVPIAEVDAVYFELDPLDDLERTLGVLASRLVLAAAAAVVVGGAVGAVVSGRVIRPLRSASAVAQDIAAGRVDARLDPARDADLEPLATSFNAMVDELQERARRESRFVSNVSHDLRGPLTSLAAAVSVVNRRRDSLPEDALGAIDALEAQVNSFSALVLDLLEISRFEAETATLVPREVDAAGYVRTVVAEHRPDLPIDTDDEPVFVELDPRRVQRAIVNVLENAERYGGGATAAAVHAAGDERVRITLDDDGPGVAPDEREAIFSRYHRGAAAAGPTGPSGTGLGLALARQHVELHGGTMFVEDAPGGGARFVIELPRRLP